MEDVDPVVLPRAVQFPVSAVCAAVVAPETMIVDPEYPTETPPAPLREKFVQVNVVALVDPVVLPTASASTVWAVCAKVEPEMMTDLPLNPTETPPAPLIVRNCETEAVVEEVEPVVLPIADQFPVSAVCAAVVAPEIITVEPEYPTDTPPAPENDAFVHVKFVELVEPAVLPTASRFTV